MNVQVNLLPEATRTRERAARQRGLIAIAAGVLVLAFVGTWWGLSAQISRAEDDLAAAQQVTSQRRAEVAALAEYAALATARDDAAQTLRAALGTEVSLAGLLQDLALALPDDLELQTVAVDLAALAPSMQDAAGDSGAADETPDDPGAVDAVGTFNIVGRTVVGHAPGVEDILRRLETVAGLKDAYLNTSTLEVPGDTDPEVQTDSTVAAFSIDGSVGPELLTRRYLDGLPEALR